MSAFAYHNPVRVELGAGKAMSLARFVEGERVVLLTYRTAAATGLLARVVAGLGRAKVRTFIIPEMPDVRDLEALHAAAWREPFDTVVAVGGGSVIDAAKVVSLSAPDAEGVARVRAVLRGASLAAARIPTVPIVAVPTTAGTGSEVTPWATIWDRGAGEKRSIEARNLFPAVAVCDPTLTLGLPRATSVSSAVDALAHALEALWNRAANPVSSALAMECVSGILEHLPRVVAEPTRLEPREGVMLAALQAGLAFSATKTGAAHALSYVATLRKGVLHGVACSLFLGPILDVLAEQRDPLVDALRGVLGARPGDGIRGFLADIGVSPRLADHGLGREDLDALVQTLRTNPRGSLSRVDTTRLVEVIAGELGRAAEAA